MSAARLVAQVGGGDRQVEVEEDADLASHADVPQPIGAIAGDFQVEAAIVADRARAVEVETRMGQAVAHFRFT